MPSCSRAGSTSARRSDREDPHRPRARPTVSTIRSGSTTSGTRHAGYQIDSERPRHNRHALKWVVFTVVAVLIAITLTGGGVGLWVTKQVNPPGRPSDPATFTVGDTDDLVTVSHRLKDQGFITHAGVFQWYVKRKGGIEFVPGYYTIKPMDTMGNIMRVLNTPPARTYTKVTFPEGFTVQQIATRLEEKVTHLSALDVMDAARSGELRSEYLPAGQTSLEGVLFPDTYQISGDESPYSVLQRMIDLMERVGGQEGLDRSGELVFRPAYEVLIVASMIEREAKVDSDRAKIARVIYNRLELGMPLQIDATLYYGHSTDESFDDLKAIDSPYNSYLYEGLPPTPIANPGRASIRAALHPAPNPLDGGGEHPELCDDIPESDCKLLYYVLADEDGSHAFAVTLQQHEFNVAVARERGLLG
ncbi:MAG: endolytic transglycosylase MltG [Ilumatobacteraceae bacterium]